MSDLLQQISAIEQRQAAARSAKARAEATLEQAADRRREIVAKLTTALGCEEADIVSVFQSRKQKVTDAATAALTSLEAKQ